jgi:putative nucleotidyltransferase with HDIG domain
MATKLDSLIQQISSLPTLPTVIVQVNEKVTNPKTSALDLARTILEDQALTARLLRLVNSPFYGFPRRIATVTEAVTILGFHPVRNLLLTASVVDLMVSDEMPEFSPTHLWEHSIGVAVAAGLLARYTQHDDREEVFVAGLLHDVGKVVLFRFATKDFLNVLETARSEDITIRAAEQRLLGFTHDQVGRLLAERWKLPVRLSEAIGCHHRPELAQIAKREAAIIHAADILARALGLGSGGDDAVPALDQDGWRRLGLPATVLEGLMGELDEQYVQARGILLGGAEGPARRMEGAHAS